MRAIKVITKKKPVCSFSTFASSPQKKKNKKKKKGRPPRSNRLRQLVLGDRPTREGGLRLTVRRAGSGGSIT